MNPRVALVLAATVLVLAACASPLPDGSNARTGRPSASATVAAAPTDDVPPSRSSEDLSRSEAVAAAFAAAPRAAEWEVVVATAGPIRDVNPNWSLADWSRDLPEGTWVWYVFLRLGDEGVMVFLDHADSRIYEVTSGIVN